MAKKSEEREVVFVKSISVALLEGDGKIRVAGSIAKSTPKTGKFGEYQQYVGTFQALVGEDVFSAPKMYVPGVIENYLEGRTGKVVFEIIRTSARDGKKKYDFKPLKGFDEIGSVDSDLFA